MAGSPSLGNRKAAYLIFMKDPLIVLRNLRQQIEASTGIPHFKNPTDARFPIIEADAVLDEVLAFPWNGIQNGVYLCHMEGREALPVEILDGQGDFVGKKMYRWFARTIPSQLCIGMPKQALLTPATGTAIPER